MEKLKFNKPLIEVILLIDDIISTSGSHKEDDSEGGGELDPVDPWALL